MNVAWLNGSWIDQERASIPADDRGFLYGDAVFETGRLLPDRRYFRLEKHLERLEASAAALALPLPPRARLLAIARGLAERNEPAHASLRITLTRGGSAGPNLLATLVPLPPDWREAAFAGWAVVTAAVRHPPPSALPPVKTPGRVHGLVARMQARASGADDGLLLSPAGDVVEGPTWNLFWRTGGTLFTPSADTGVLEGVTRAALLDLAPTLGFEVVEGSFPRAVLDDAEEVFATMTSTGVVPFRSLDGRDLEPGARVAAGGLADAYWSLVEREAAQ